MRPLGQLEGWCLAPGCCLLIPTTRRSRHNRCWRPIASHKPGLSSHSEHPFTSSSHLPDFPQSLLSNFSVLPSFLFLSPPIYQISPVVSNLILNLAFVIFKTSSFFPVQQISPCRSFLFLTSPLPPIYRIRILLYFPLVVTSHLFLII